MMIAMPDLGENNGQHGNAAVHPALRDVLVCRVAPSPEARIVVHSDPHGPGTDRFRFLRLRLRELRKERKLQMIAVTSAQPQDGKSTVASNLATILAEGGKTAVLCVEADLYHPTLCQNLNLQPAAGLADVIEHQSDPISSLLRIEPLGWYVLPAGRCEGNPTELLHSNYLAQVLIKLRPCFEWIILDSPPVLAVTDTMIIAEQLDGAFLVVRAGETAQEKVDEALTLLGEEKVLGIVLNDVKDLSSSYAKYYGAYYRRRAK